MHNLVILLLFLPVALFGQAPSAKLDRAAEQGNMRKVERCVKQQIKRMRHGFVYNNGRGSGLQVNHGQTFDSLVAWLKKHPATEDAIWDKCVMKIAIYPGGSVLGARFKTRKGTKEVCFHVQKGTLGNRVFPSRNILVYKRMSNCPGFVEEQKQNCGKNH